MPRKIVVFSRGAAHSMIKATYKDAGVDLEVYEESMSRLPSLMGRTFSPRVIPSEGGFAGMFQLDFSSPLFARNYQEPVLVSCTDGVGTKLKVATLANKHNTIGIDLVAMCVNDALCCGAEPLFFLDYVAMSHDDPDLLEQIVEGIVAGCEQCDCALMGGETAILPDLYARGDYDLAGFCVGVVERQKRIDGSAVAPGDIVLGLTSTGLHSNGYSLVRRIVFDIAKLNLTDPVENTGRTVEQWLLEPTRIYAKCVRQMLRNYRKKQVVHAIAHITGGGLHENLARVLPEGAQAVIERGSWPIPEVFPWLQKLGNVDPDEMDRVFNMGVGLALVVSPYFAESIRNQLADCGYESHPIGQIVEGPTGVVWKA